jgi:hypothetical protein
MNHTGIPLWYILRQVQVKKGESKIEKLLSEERVVFRGASPHEYAEHIYWRYLKIYKTLYADLNVVNAKFIRRYRTKGNFCVDGRLGVGFVEVSDNAWETPFYTAQQKSGLEYDDFKSLMISGSNKRNEYMETETFKKLKGEARTLKILTEEMKGVLNGKVRISRK